MSIRTKILPCSIAASSIALASAALHADPASFDQTAPSAVVRFSDLNLDEPSGVAKLYYRISVAASQVCGPPTITGTFYTSPGYRRCYFNAISQAVTSVNSASLSRYYEARLGRRTGMISVATR